MIDRRTFTSLFGAAALSLAAKPIFAQAGTSLDRVKASGVLRTAGIPDGVPYYQKSVTDGSWRGFYVDIVNKLAADLGLKVEMIESTWGNTVLDLQSDKIDVFFGLNPTPERQKVIDFSGPVFNNAYALVAKESVTATTWEELNTPDFRVSVDAGSSNDAAVTRHLPDATILRLKTQSDATAALQAGRADAQSLVLMQALPLRAKNPQLGKVLIPSPMDATTSNAGFRREEDKSWMEFVDSWISEQRQSGFIRAAIIKNMELVGVSEADFPEGFQI